ncbi:hypothetical protein T459_25412 [Capsicum annuum]|uniref:NADH:quinone oxidoreductase/Mrp antiporter membrane subunit domain-containing protein n=1 Tax=Capsicum annuum TaxID=4072 RepID=A0A2G2YKP2_CAPAN|nr:hypothetical protein T459_25412 [Capsicum annuum]
MTYHRIHLIYLDEMGGIAIIMPKIFTMFCSFLMASLALPGMSGFLDSFFDSGPRELFLSISIYLPVIGICMYSGFLLSLAIDKVEVILSNFFIDNLDD